MTKKQTIVKKKQTLEQPIKYLKLNNSFLNKKFGKNQNLKIIYTTVDEALA